MKKKNKEKIRYFVLMIFCYSIVLLNICFAYKYKMYVLCGVCSSVLSPLMLFFYKLGVEIFKK